MNLKLRDYPTLNHVIGFVYEMRPDLDVASDGQYRSASGTDSAAHLCTATPGPPSIRSRTQVLALVAEKTGYPPDMLDLDLDLEADLGVDTVKQAETFAAIREMFTIPSSRSFRRTAKLALCP